MNTNTTNLIAEYKRRLAVMEAATPHNVEYQDQTHHDPVWQHTSIPLWNWVNCDYRIKPEPEPKYRAWTIDEVPVGAVVRLKGEPLKRGVISSLIPENPCYIRVIHFGDMTCERAKDLYEVSYDFCKTWQPCGVL